MSWYNEPIVVALVSAIIVAIVSVMTNRYIVRPKYCSIQEDKCKKMFKAEVGRVENLLKEEIRGMRNTHERHNAISHEVFARKDVIGPQLEETRREIIYIRKRIDQLADDRQLPPIKIIADGDE